jgi:inhibitor of cysteine peptidase
MNPRSQAGFLAALLVIIVGGMAYLFMLQPQTTTPPQFQKFVSEQEFVDYYENSQYYNPLYGISSGMAGIGDLSREVMASTPAQAASPEGGETYSEPDRISETNVQVEGIDEPDIVKTNGMDIYFSTNSYRFYWGMSFYYPYFEQGKVEVVGAFPPENLREKAEISDNGDLLLYNTSLVVFSYDKITGYDVSDPETPSKSWEMKLNNSYIVTSRLYNGKVYLVTQTSINTYSPCPMVPLTVNGVAEVIPCTSIYHPIDPVSVDVTYNAMVIDPASGDIEKTVSFVGASSQSILYMSANSLYITYPIHESTFNIYYGLIKERCRDIFPASVIQRLDTIASYDISEGSKINEMDLAIGGYLSGLGEDESLRISNELFNRSTAYMEEHKRDFTRTGIVKIGLDLEIESTSSFPGSLLNQFSLDEYNGDLRVATTVGSSSWSTLGNANDVYVLDDNLDIIGSVLDLGTDERIYSARFIGDKGYLVTFRQTDPFYILDLSSPTNPQLKGELKIPGYSSYLHPISSTRILGIGKEGSYVKVSLFDVTSAENPSEVSKYTLQEYWTDVMNNHHAFLLDNEHDIFFLPGSSGGYIFSYENDSLSLVKTLSGYGAKRAVYVDNCLYIIWEDKIVILDENNWEEVNSLELGSA